MVYFSFQGYSSLVHVDEFKGYFVASLYYILLPSALKYDILRGGEKATQFCISYTCNPRH